MRFFLLSVLQAEWGGEKTQNIRWFQVKADCEKNAENRILCGSMFCQQTRTLESNEKTKQHKTCACAFTKIELRVNTVSTVPLDAVTLNPCLWGKLGVFI